MQQFQIRKDAFSTTRIVDGSYGALEQGTVRAKVDRFALTANNITYAAAGDRIGYWHFFPPAGDGEGWGVVPVWGFADIVESTLEGIDPGERLFGYWPPATELILQPQRVTDELFFDGSAHRAQLPAGYNVYRRVQGEPDYRPEHEELRMLLWPLFLTSWCLTDALEDNAWFGAEQVVILSASSKTSIGLAYGLAGVEGGPAVVGMTSPGNLSMVEGLGPYSTALTYDAVDSVDASKPTAIVDMSGNGKVLGALHRHLGDHMKKTYFVGMTHWDQAAPSADLIQDRSEFFFAPSHIEKRMKDWGAAEFGKRSSSFVMGSAAKTRDWLKIETVEGLQGMAEVFADVCEGRVAPDRGLIVRV